MRSVRNRLLALSRRLIQPAGDQLVADVVGEDVGAPEGIGDEAQSLPRFRLRRQPVALQVGDHVLRVPALLMEQERRVARNRAQDALRGADGDFALGIAADPGSRVDALAAKADQLLAE